MKKLVEKAKIKVLKMTAKGHYEAYTSALGRYDCGATLAMHVNPDARRSAVAFNKTMDKLALPDPECPKFRIDTNP